MANSIKHILVGIDGSKGGTHAAEFAGTLARATGARVTLILAHDPDVYVVSGPGEAAWISSQEYEELHSRFTEQLREKVSDPAFKAAVEALGDVGAAPKQIVTWGHPAETLCEQAKRDGVDLIVMGSRGRSAFTSLVLGSVSSQVLHHAPCPVTIVR
ncbi:MAG: universal stress protein [Gammaproteobacteria bacterium]|nr:universal stress protein [Gammaproteobacteria bacterium]